jgi:glutathione S-transferase
MTITLWHFRYSHCNEKVRWALDHEGMAHERVSLVPGFHIPTMLRLTGQPLTPVVSFDGELVVDSTAIIAAIEARVPAPRLYPDDPEARARALALEDWFDDNVGADVRRLFYGAYLPGARRWAAMSTAGKGRGSYLAYLALSPLLAPVVRHNMKINPTRLAHARANLAGYFRKICDELRPSGYLVGDDFSVADLTAAALLAPLARPPELGEALPDDPPDAWTELCDEVASHEGCAWVRDMYRRHRL